MRPLVIQAFTAASCIGRGLEQTLAALIGERSGLEPCRFETVTLDTHVGEVIGVDDRTLPAELRRFDCRNNRLAELGLRQDGFDEAVERAAQRFGRRRIGVFMGTSTSGILQTELAYRRRDPVSGALPPDFDYGATHNSFSVADYLRRRLELEGPAVVVSCACASSAKVFATARRMLAGGSDRRGTGRRGRLALPDDALRFSLAAAVLAGTLPSFRRGARRHLDRRGSRIRARRTDVPRSGRGRCAAPRSR